MSNPMITGSPCLRAGYHLKLLREKMGLTLQQADRATAARFGEERRVRYQQISRIEKAQFEKPPIVDLIRLGAIYGLTPDDIGEMYGLWPRGARSVGMLDLDPKLQRAIEVARQIQDPEALRDFLAWIEMATFQAQARIRERGEQAG